MSYLGPIFPFLILEFWFQQWTLLDAEEREGGWKIIYWQGLEFLTAANLRCFKRLKFL